MGTDLEDTLEKLKEFRDQVDYWLECTGKPNSLVDGLLRQIEMVLRDHNERMQ